MIKVGHKFKATVWNKNYENIFFPLTKSHITMLIYNSEGVVFSATDKTVISDNTLSCWILTLAML